MCKMLPLQIPSWQKKLLLLLMPVLRFFIMTFVNTEDESKVQRSKDAVLAAMKEVDGILAGGNKFLLGTEDPTYVDFAFASMASFLIFPENYGGGAITK